MESWIRPQAKLRGDTEAQIQKDIDMMVEPPLFGESHHKQLIEKALSEGKPVPPEVLADYPDLAPKAEVKTYIHETDAPTFTKFDMSKVGSGQGEAWLGRGIYLQEKGSFKFEQYGKNKIEAQLTPDAKIFEVKYTPDGKYGNNFVEWAVNNNIGTAKEQSEARIAGGLSLHNLLPREIIRNHPEVVEQLKQAGYDGLLQDGELVVYNEKVIKVAPKTPRR